MVSKDLKILVICGGVSRERDVSLRSGRAVYGALLEAGFINVELFDLTKESIGELFDKDVELAYLALHGRGGEDGCIQGMLELLGIPYTGSRVEASACCMDKIRTKEILAYNGLPTPKYIKLTRSDVSDVAVAARRIEDNIGLPVVLKSPLEGSSIGVVIVKDSAELEGAVKEVFEYGDTLLAEEFVDGIELTLPILGNEELRALTPIEITSENEFYDYESKYTAGMCHHIIPARISDGETENVKSIGLHAYKSLGCAGLSRIDFIIDKKKGPMVIEINTLPGMTEMSLFPDSARYEGISFPRLVETVVEYAIENFNSEREKI